MITRLTTYDCGWGTGVITRLTPWGRGTGTGAGFIICGRDLKRVTGLTICDYGWEIEIIAGLTIYRRDSTRITRFTIYKVGIISKISRF